MEFLAIPILFFLLWLGFMVVALLAMAFWIWMVVDCATNRELNSNDRLVWILVVLLTSVIGAVIYYVVVKRQAKQSGASATHFSQVSRLPAADAAVTDQLRDTE